MGLQKNIYDPYLYTGFIQDPDDSSDTPSLVPFTLGLYMDDFLFFFTSDTNESKSQSILSRIFMVDFMGVVE